MRTIAIVVVAASISLSSAGLLAQQSSTTPATSDHDIELMRKDVRSAEKQIVAANMVLTESEAQAFWPIYDKYKGEAIKINDVKLSVIKQYAANYDSLTDAQAASLVKQWAEADESALQLRTKYIPMFEKVLPGKKAARFFQIDRRVALLMDLQLTSEIPIVSPD